MAMKCNDTILRQYHEVCKLVDMRALPSGSKDGFAQAKGLSRTTLSKRYKAWKLARGL